MNRFIFLHSFVIVIFIVQILFPNFFINILKPKIQVLNKNYNNIFCSFPLEKALKFIQQVILDDAMFHSILHEAKVHNIMSLTRGFPPSPEIYETNFFLYFDYKY
jgi:hypothetical protein